MPLLNLTRVFSLTVLQSNGQGLAGATVRILNSQGAEVMAQLFDTLPLKTDASGILLKKWFVFNFQAVPAGIYTIQATAPGYQPASIATLPTFTGAGTFTINMVRLSSAAIAGSYDFTPPAYEFVSPLYEVETTVEAAGTYEWELIQFGVSNGAGQTSLLNAPVHPVSQVARADLRSRINLEPIPHFVADTDAVLIDPDFSNVLTVTTASVSAGGTTSFGSVVSITAANMVPNVPRNDLTSYANPAPALVPWISLLSPVTLFRGYYLDVMIWLIHTADTYVLHQEELNSAGAVLYTVPNRTIAASPQVLRVKVLQPTSEQTRLIKLWVTVGQTTISELLTLDVR